MQKPMCASGAGLVPGPAGAGVSPSPSARVTSDVTLDLTSDGAPPCRERVALQIELLYRETLSSYRKSLHTEGSRQNQRAPHSPDSGVKIGMRGFEVTSEAWRSSHITLQRKLLFKELLYRETLSLHRKSLGLGRLRVRLGDRRTAK